MPAPPPRPRDGQRGLLATPLLAHQPPVVRLHPTGSRLWRHAYVPALPRGRASPRSHPPPPTRPPTLCCAPPHGMYPALPLPSPQLPQHRAVQGQRRAGADAGHRAGGGGHPDPQRQLPPRCHPATAGALRRQPRCACPLPPRVHAHRRSTHTKPVSTGCPAESSLGTCTHASGVLVGAPHWALRADRAC